MQHCVRYYQMYIKHCCRDCILELKFSSFKKLLYYSWVIDNPSVKVSKLHTCVYFCASQIVIQASLSNSTISVSFRKYTFPLVFMQ